MENIYEILSEPQKYFKIPVFDFEFRFLASISSFDFKFRFRVSISSFNFKFRVSIGYMPFFKTLPYIAQIRVVCIKLSHLRVSNDHHTLCPMTFYRLLNFDRKFEPILAWLFRPSATKQWRRFLGPNTTFGHLNHFCARRGSHHFNLEIWEHSSFKLLMKLFF